jgi:hypothetical protein
VVVKIVVFIEPAKFGGIVVLEKAPDERIADFCSSEHAIAEVASESP